MALVRWEPFRDIERFFEDFPGTWPLRLGWDLALDMYEEGNQFVVEMNLPGINPEKLEITLEDNHLRISGTREEVQETKDKTYYAKEIRRGSFERTIRLPANVKESDVKAEYKNGVLRVYLPKDEGKKINVKVASE